MANSSARCSVKFTDISTVNGVIVLMCFPPGMDDREAILGGSEGAAASCETFFSRTEQLLTLRNDCVCLNFIITFTVCIHNDDDVDEIFPP